MMGSGRRLLPRGLRDGLSRLLLLVATACTPGEPVALDDPLPELWSTDFEGASEPLVTSEGPWRAIFGGLVRGEGTPGVRADGNPEDGSDDYAYRPQAATDLLIQAEVDWDTEDAVGVDLVVPPGDHHEALYELTLFDDHLMLLRYDGGGDPSVYEFLRSTGPLELPDGRYSLALRARHDGTRWRLLGELRRGSSQGESIATVGEVRDRTHGPSIGQGVGIYDRSGRQATVVRSMTVRGRGPDEAPGT